MVRVEAAKVFTTESDKGNLAGVVLDAQSLSDREMQSIAHSVNASETSFILPSTLADLRVRWFTPNNEVGICVHATIAAVGAWAEFRKDQRSSFSVETRNSVLHAQREGTAIFINVPGYSVEDRKLDESKLCSSFGIGREDLEGPIGIIRIYEDLELIVPVKSLATLEGLNPSIEKYSEICRAAGVTGICLFARQSYSGAHDIHMREFAPLYGYLEDPLCGMASGCVLTYLRAAGQLVESIKVEQGHFCGTAGTIFARYDPQTGPWIGGECIFGKAIEVRV